MNFWQLSAGSERLTLGVKMHSAAAFISMPNSDGVVLGGNSIRGFNDNKNERLSVEIDPHNPSSD